MPDHVVSDLASPTTMHGVPAVHSSWFGMIPAPPTLASLTELVFALHRIRPGTRFIWRGQADCTWRLEPGAARRVRAHPKTAKSNLEMAVSRYEDELINDAMRAGHVSGTDSDLQRLAQLQHHGAATRMLDFSLNPLVASWFACTNATERPGMLFALARDAGEPRHADTLGTPLYELLRTRHAFIWQPQQTIGRIQAQQSVFLVSTLENCDWGVYPWAFNEGEPDWVKRELLPIYIPSAFKAEARESLWENCFGFSLSTMFPDLPGFSASHSTGRPLPGSGGWRAV